MKKIIAIKTARKYSQFGMLYYLKKSLDACFPSTKLNHIHTIYI